MIDLFTVQIIAILLTLRLSFIFLGVNAADTFQLKNFPASKLPANLHFIFTKIMNATSSICLIFQLTQANAFGNFVGNFAAGN